MIESYQEYAKSLHNLSDTAAVQNYMKMHFIGCSINDIDKPTWGDCIESKHTNLNL